MPRLDRYELGEEIGAGASARVCRAFDPDLRRPVAVKIMHAHLRGSGTVAERFRREAQSVAALEHPNVVRIYDVAPPGSDEIYFVAELMEGGTVAAWLEAEPGHRLPHEVALAAALQVLRGLEAAHKAGLIHRDLKPANLMLSSDGFVKITDFGIARLADRADVTKTGELIGSPAYMSPEQIDGKPVDARTDLFSFGVVFYLLLSGQLPYDDPSLITVFKRIAAGDHTPIRELEPTLDPRVASLIERCLSVDAQKRPASAQEAREILAAVARARRLGDPAEEIAAYRNGDEESRRRRSYGVVESLVDEARVLLAEKRDPALAMSLIDRALEIQPFHFEAYRLLQQSSGGSRKRKALLFAGGLLVAAALVVGGWLLISALEPDAPGGETIPSATSAPAPQPAMAMLVPPPPDRQAATVPDAPREAAAPALAQAAAKPAAPPEAAAAKAAFGTLHLVTRPWADVYLDGNEEKVGTTPVLQELKLRAGKHTVRLLNPHTHFVEFEVEIDPGEKLHKVVELPLLPGLLQVLAGHDDVVLIDGAPVRPDKTREPLQLPHGAHVVTFRRGMLERTVEVEVMAGRMVEARSPFLVPPAP